MQWCPSNKSSYSSSLIKISSPGIRCEPSARLTTATLRPGMTVKTLYSSLGWHFLAPMERLWICTGEFVQYQAPRNSNILCHSCASEFHRTRQRRQTRSASFCGSPSALRGVNRAGARNQREERRPLRLAMRAGHGQARGGTMESRIHRGIVRCPNGAHDDQVDAASTAFRALLRRITWHAVA